MPRVNRRRRDAPAAAGALREADRTEEHPDGTWVVRSLPGAGSAKTYRCPGCDHEIRPGTPHVVVWREGDVAGRRHWHRPCWVARLRRHVRSRRPTRP